MFNVGWGKVASVSLPSIQSREEWDVLPDVLDSSTWYVVFDGRNHCWPAMLDGPGPTLADLAKPTMIT